LITLVLPGWLVSSPAVLPRSSRPDRVRENSRVLDVALSPERVAARDDLGEGLVTGWGPATTLGA